jgi:hypothetical protein
MTGPRATASHGPRSLLPVYLIALAAVALLFLLFQGDAIWSGSVDLSHHYALAYRLSENWRLVPNDPTLGEMNVYPRLAHVAAALAGVVLHSTVLGMQVVALGSLVLVWGAYLLMLTTLPRRAAGFGAVVLVLLMCTNRIWFNLPMHGAEIAGSYFFSQLAAQALALLVMALAMRLEQRASRWHAYALLLAALWVVASTHLLPAIELLGVVAGLLVIDVIAPGARPRRVVPSVVLLVAGVALIVKHPTFAVMRSIADNDGALTLVGFSQLRDIAVLCVGTLMVSCALLAAWWRDLARPPVLKYLAVYGASAAALCLVQLVLVHLHVGSDYAVKKYVFGLLSFLVVALAALAGKLLARYVAPSAQLDDAKPHPALVFFRSDTLACAIFVLAIGVVAVSAVKPPKVFDVSDVVATERQLIAMRDTVLTVPPPGQYHHVMDLLNQPSAVGYMFALGIMHVPREMALHDNFSRDKMGPIAQYASIIAARGQGRYANYASCARPGGPLMVLDPKCLQEAIVAASTCKGTLDFSATGNVDASMLSSFSGAEALFRWTDGAASTVTCAVAEPVHTAILKLSAFITPQHMRQRASVSVNGGSEIEMIFRDASQQDVTIPLPASAPGTKLVFTFKTPDAVSPKQLGMTTDGRVLGLAVQSIAFK